MIVEADITRPSDGAMEIAKAAYDIYRGMKTEPPYIPHWDELKREERGLLEWTVRFAKMNER